MFGPQTFGALISRGSFIDCVDYYQIRFKHLNSQILNITIFDLWLLYSVGKIKEKMNYKEVIPNKKKLI